jgi:ubiquinone/menaquinone biosynthesis C-methylase UbiE
MANKQAEFWTKVTRSYDRVVDRQIGGATRSMVRERLSSEEALGRTVELGCGTGFYTDLLARRAGTLVATDLSEGMLDVARQVVVKANVSFRCEDCQQTSLPAGSFDTAFLGLVLHFTEPARTLAEMHRLLRPGGRLIIANIAGPALGGFDRTRAVARILWQGISGYRIKPPKGFGRNVLRSDELRELLERTGFEVAASETLRDPSRSSNVPIEYVRATRV